MFDSSHPRLLAGGDDNCRCGRPGKMMRGDFVTIAIPGDFGKPRPALVIQANQFSEHASVTVRPSAANGLRKPSRMMIDKAMTVKCGKAGAAFGRISREAMVEARNDAGRPGHWKG